MRSSASPPTSSNCSRSISTPVASGRKLVVPALLSLYLACAPPPGAEGAGGTGVTGAGGGGGRVDTGPGGNLGSGGATGTGGAPQASGGRSGDASGGRQAISTGGSPATGGAGGSPEGSGGSATGGASGQGGAASGGNPGGTGGRGGSGVGGAAAGGRTGGTGGAGGGSGPFVCNQVTGGKLTEEWFIAGFEKAVDNARWQVKWREDGYVQEWANPQSAFWNAPVDSACSSGTTSPDRVVFGAVTWKYKTQAEFRTALTQAVSTFKAKYPNLRRIDMVTQIRGPNNMNCPTPPIAGEPIAVPAIQDAAMDEVAAAFPGFVFVGPKVEAKACSDFVGGGPHLTAAGNMANVGPLAAYFAAAQ